ncbi:MAG: hypothetical protein EZS28_000233 [Streblomastix strix]|uniref:Protein kinase domain-containing protein n=1 Tax=Streblomastix strix TaxID=222440 RepID=A0A5J4XBQ4_9EUKA|nr:MAG: hypothetical protein EZS28_000233 [Streblomastix strix]
MVLVTLADLYRLGKGRIPLGKTIKLFKRILRALQSLHEKGKSLGNMRSDAVLVSKKGEIQFLGTNTISNRSYFSPEALLLTEDKNMDAYKTAANDIWAFGILFAEAIIGEPVLQAEKDEERFNFMKENFGELDRSTFAFVPDSKFKKIPHSQMSSLKQNSKISGFTLKERLIIAMDRLEQEEEGIVKSTGQLPFSQSQGSEYQYISPERKSFSHTDMKQAVIDFLFKRCFRYSSNERARSASECLQDRVWIMGQNRGDKEEDRLKEKMKKIKMKKMMIMNCKLEIGFTIIVID